MEKINFHFDILMLIGWVQTIIARVRAWVSIVVSVLAGFISRLFSLCVGSDDDKNVELSIFEKAILLPFLRNSKIPAHVGFIMDGNRRYARSLDQPSLLGHKMGYTRLRRVLLWCFELGIKEVSVYAFSVDNFSRSHEEVDYLMDLAVEKFNLMCEDDSFIMKQRIRVRVCGERSLLRADLLEVIDRLESKTRDHTKGVFNILIAYSSKREIQQAIEKAQLDVSSTGGSLKTDDEESTQIIWEKISSHLYIQTPLDLLVRTSGETRLSDFLLWQIQPEKTLIIFEKTLWPNYSISSFVKSLLRYSLVR
jgi:ditrans,polycis-polyprenyl diphosphate synthase